MRELRVDINNKIATYNTRSGVIVCGNTNYKIKFTFDEEWDEFEYKTARFAWNDKYIDVVFYGDSVAVPMLSQATVLTVGVFAGENLHTTTPAKIPCMLSILCVSDRAKEAEYYEVDGTLEYRLPAIRPEDHSKILQAVNGKYELREAPDLTMNEGMVSAALETKVKPVQDKVKELETEIDEVKTNFGGEALRGEINKLYALIVGNAWLLNETFDDEIFESNLEYTLNFASNGQHFAKIEFSKTTNANGIDTHLIHYCDADGNRTRVYTTNKTNRWEDEAYRDIVTEDAVSLDRVATRVKEEEETDAITLVGAINELGDKVETNQTAIERLNKLPAIIFETEEDIAELAKKFNLDTVTIVGAIDKLATTTNNLNKQYEGIKEDMDAICIPFEFKKFGAEIEFGGLYINIDTLKVWIKIAGYKYTISDWEQVQAILEWIKGFCGGVGEVVEDFGEEALVIGEKIGNAIASGTKEALDWVNDVGEAIKGFIIAIYDFFGWENPFPEDEKPNNQSTETAGTVIAGAIAGAIEAQKKAVSPAWKLNDTFANTDIFDYEFDFTSNGKIFSRMRSQINTSDNGLQTYVIHYIWYENGEERQTTAYSSAKSGGWLDTAYQTVYACNPTASSTFILNNIAGASWKLNEKLNSNIREFELACDFIANNETYKKIIVKLANRVGVYNPDYEFDTIEYVRKEDGVSLCVYYYNPHHNTGGWLNPLSPSGAYDCPTSRYRDITILAPTDEIAFYLRKIGVEQTEQLDTTSQTMTGGLNEINRYMGNLSELEVKEFTPYSMSRSVEEEEEAPEQDTLVKAINRVYRRTVAMQETIDEVDTKIYEIINGKTWVLHQNLYDYYNESFTYNFNFTSNGTRFNKMLYDYLASDGGEPDEYRLYYYTADGTEILVCDFGGYRADWRYGEEYRTIITTDDISLEHIAVLESGKEDDAPTLVAGNNIEIIPNEEANTVEIKLADSITLKGNYPLALTKGTDEYKGYCYINPPALPSGTIDLHIPSKSGTIALLSDLEGLGGSSKAIIDVTELPTENINEEAFYRMLTGKWVFDGEVYNSYTCYCVDNLPEVGEVATTDMVTITAYYCVADGVVYGYVDDMLGGYFSIPSGWYSADMLFSVAGIGYGGVVTNMTDTALDGVLRLLLDYSLYTHKQGKWETLKGVGQAGTGMNAEVFNGILNEAKGDFSHARGRGTIAEGECSSASGRTTLAQGDYSSAEGLETASLGQGTHTEGFGTSAIGDFSHAQGKFNLLDDEGKYAHIVGNGEDGARSNAHTIDWQGNAWFSGKIYTGGTGQDDENAKELATKDDLSNLATVDKVGYVSNHDDIAEVMDDSDGIYWESVSKYYDSDFNEITAVTMAQKIPLVAGKNVTFSYDEENQFVKINATGGGSAEAVSKIGTWTVIDEPSIPSSYFPLTFTSNGVEYTALNTSSMGSSSWGINTLAYQQNDGAYVSVYVNNPSESYGITHGWRDEAYKSITVTEEPTDPSVIAWLENNTDAPKGSPSSNNSNGLEMPQIRFTTANGNDRENSTFYVDEENPLKLTVEIVGGGALQVGDQLQVCKQKRFDGCRANGYKRKYKLQRFVEYVVTEEDLNKRFLTVNIVTDQLKVMHGLFRDGKEASLSPLYLRIRRSKGDMQNNDSGQTVDATFSNVVTVWKSYHRSNHAIRIY